MRVIPVLDIKAGVVVHATGGNRESYRAIETPLSASADPLDVARGLLALFPFDALYIADLDGIAGRGRNHDTICALRSEIAGIELWVDDGSASVSTIAALARMAGVTPVVGSETLTSIATLDDLRAMSPGDWMLSLDFKGDRFLGPAGLLNSPALWPDTVIAMTLAAVGAKAGPDLERVRELKAAKPTSGIVAAGGVRDGGDLLELGRAGASAVLVATALHSGTIKAGDLERVAGL
ncbi:MAG: nickel transporter [Hyphomicrobiaceae bacterium]|nr:nickel transporter [Hyphomicrobiaceae bacterium]